MEERKKFDSARFDSEETAAAVEEMANSEFENGIAGEEKMQEVEIREEFELAEEDNLVEISAVEAESNIDELSLIEAVVSATEFDRWDEIGSRNEAEVECENDSNVRAVAEFAD